MDNLPSFSNDTIVPTSIITNNTVLGSGDVFVHRNFVNENEGKEIFEKLLNEVDFQQWYHMPSKNSDPLPLKRVKRIMVNPDFDGNLPYYRFTVNDQSSHGIISPMHPIIGNLCQRINKFLNVELNHAVILLYRNGTDCIGFHKDKTLDLDENSPIVSLSLGCTRTYCLQDTISNPKIHQEIDLESGTLLVLGPVSNEYFYHSIKPSEDKEDKHRISITFRRATSYKLPDGTIVGKGDKYQTLNWPEELKGNHIIDFKA